MICIEARERSGDNPVNIEAHFGGCDNLGGVVDGDRNLLRAAEKMLQEMKKNSVSTRSLI